MLGRKKANKKAQSQSTKSTSKQDKLVSEYQKGVSIQQIADDNDMTAQEVEAVVVNE